MASTSNTLPVIVEDGEDTVAVMKNTSSLPAVNAPVSAAQATQILWQHQCEDKRWCPSCSIHMPEYQTALEEGTNDEAASAHDALAFFSYDGLASAPALNIHLTDSMILDRFTRDELVSIKAQAIRSGLLGLSIRAGAAIRNKIENGSRPHQ